MKEPATLLGNRCVTITGIHSGTVYTNNSETNQVRNEPNSHANTHTRARAHVFIYLLRGGGSDRQI